MLVNGALISGEAPLRDGDEIHIGATKIVYSEIDYPDAQSAIIGVRPGGQYRRSTIMRPNE